MPAFSPTLLRPQWPAPLSVEAFVTTRVGGYSQPPYGATRRGGHGLNLGSHVGDDLQAVANNRELIAQQLPSAPLWLNQIHSSTVLLLDEHTSAAHLPAADGVVTASRQMVCAVLTADCLPILFCDQAGNAVGAAHAGWRGLCDGIVEKVACAHMKLAGCASSQQMAWVGPAISAKQFEVGEDVREAFMNAAWADEKKITAQAFFAASRKGKWFCDLSLLAQVRLARAGVRAVYLSGRCTMSEEENFYSYRRDGVTGRMAGLIWLK